MRTSTIAVLATLVGLAGPLSAQTELNLRVAQAMSGGRYQSPLCPLPGGDFHTSSAGLSLKVATEGFKDASIGQSQVNSKTYTEGVKKAIASSLEAIAAKPTSAAGWYYYGRASLALGDLRAADSAFTKLETLSPGCADEIKSMRQRAWVVLVNPSSEFLKNQQFDSALAILRDANVIARYYPQAYYNLGATFANMKPNVPDSAIYYFKLAEQVSGNDPQVANTKKLSIYNIGLIYDEGLHDNANAVVYYRKYLAIDPGNEEVTQALARALRNSGNTAEATQLDNERYASGKMTPGEIAARGVKLFNDKDYAGAADAFKKVLAGDPNNHDALFNLANAYYALEWPDSLIQASQKLLASDPLNTTNLRLLANGYRLAKNQDKQIDVVMQLQAMTTGISVDSFMPRKDGAHVAGTATGVEGQTPAGKTIAPTAITLVFDLIDSTGATVVTKNVDIPALKPGDKAPFSLDAAGANISGWKYHKQ